MFISLYLFYSILFFTSPILYHITALPSVVKNCSFNNQTQHSVEVQCTAGYDGGLPQIFVLELISTKTGRVKYVKIGQTSFYFFVFFFCLKLAMWVNLISTIIFFVLLSIYLRMHRYNLTNFEEPFFVIESLDATTLLENADDRSYKVVLFSVNQKGRSPRVILKDLLIGESNITHSGEFFCFVSFLTTTIPKRLRVKMKMRAFNENCKGCNFPLCSCLRFNFEILEFFSKTKINHIINSYPLPFGIFFF